VISENSQGLQGLKFHVSIEQCRASNANSWMRFAPPAALVCPRFRSTVAPPLQEKPPAPFFYSVRCSCVESHKSMPSCHLGVLPARACLGLTPLRSRPSAGHKKGISARIADCWVTMWIPRSCTEPFV